MKESRQSILRDAQAAAEEVAAALGLEIVEFIFHSRGKHSVLRIDIDRPGPEGVGLRDCETLSRALDEHLERLEFFDDTYELQVSSPGIDRPIRTPDDLRRNTGRFVRLEYRDGSRVRETTGTLVGSDPAGSAVVATPDGEIAIPFERIVLMKQAVTPSGRRAPKG